MDETASDLTRQMRKSVKNKRAPGSGGGGSFSDRYTPAEGAAGKISPIVLFRANYAMPITKEDGKGTRKFESPYGIVGRHYHKPSNKFGRCSAGFADVPDQEGNIVMDLGSKPCLGCHEAAKGKDTGMAWAKKLHVFNAIEMADFHLVNSDRKNERTGEFYKDPKKCEGRACKLCNQGVEKRFGRRVYWPLGPSYTEQLTDFADFTLAMNCRCGGTITTPAYECPQCGECFRDLESHPATDEELEDIRLEMHKCGACGYSGYMKAVNECDQCREAKPLKLWDVKMELYTSGDGPTTSLQVRRFKLVTEDEWKQIEPLMKPVDLNRVFPVLSIKDQAKIYKLKIPQELRESAVEEESKGADADEGDARSGSSGWDDEE